MAREPLLSSRVKPETGTATRKKVGTLQKVVKRSRAGRLKLKDVAHEVDTHVDTTMELRGLRNWVTPDKRLLDPSRELEVLKCITLREGYLERLKHLVKAIERETEQSLGQVQVLPPGMVDLLDLLRSITLDTVEAITLWRLSLVTPTPAPFEWNGRNYLLKMLHDCDFLDGIEALGLWLGFSPTHNPFLMPEDTMIKALSKSGALLENEGLPGLHCLHDKTGLHLGMQPWREALKLTAGGDTNSGIVKPNITSRKRCKMYEGSRLAAYTAPIINDPSLLPAGNIRPPTREAASFQTVLPVSKKDQLLGSLTHASVHVAGIVSNLISREDVKRVMVARQVLIQEEARTLAAAASTAPDHESTPVIPVTEISMTRKNQNVLTSLSKYLSGKGVARSMPNNSNQSTNRSLTLKAGYPLRLPEQSNQELDALVTATAGLIDQAPLKPHPGLGAILLRSDLQGNKPHLNPFIHTLCGQRFYWLSDRKPTLRAGNPRLPETNERERSTVPLLSNASTGVTMHSVWKMLRRSSTKRGVVKAHVKITDGSSLQSVKGCEDSEYTSCELCKESIAPKRRQLDPSVKSLVSSRKAGAELTALTAAGTSGRRQPPLREERLRRLERDVSRYSVDLWELLKAEQLLQRNLACQGRTIVDDGSLLRAKQREIKWKTFDLKGKKDELRCLRMVQQHKRDKKERLETERRRRRLGEGQTLQEDEKVAETLEDNAALVVQRRFRGNKGRAFAVLYKNTINQAARTIQRTVRFVWDRRTTRHKLLLHTSVKHIQAAIRTYVVRTRYVRLLRHRKEMLACSQLQRVCHGMHGRRRAAARRTMKAAASKALAWVSLDTLQPKHLEELANVIRSAIVDPLVSNCVRSALDALRCNVVTMSGLRQESSGRPSHEFPPVGVLGALRAVLTILDKAGAEIGTSNGSYGSAEIVTFETALGRIVRAPVAAPDLTWEMAARVLGRPYRLLRRMRAFASGLGASFDPTPTRILRLSPEALKLLYAYHGDPSWSEDALRSIKKGGTASASLVGWARELMTVYREQSHVEDFLRCIGRLKRSARDAQPTWLRKSRSFQRRRRALELVAESCRCAGEVASECRYQMESSGHAYRDPLMANAVLEARCKDADAAIRDLESKRIAFLAAQAKAEAAAGRSLKESMEFAEREASIAARAEKMALRLGQCSPEHLAELARKKQHWEVVLRDMRRRLEVWERHCREESGPLLQEWVPPPEDQISMSRALGFARGWEAITFQQKDRLVEEAGGRRFVKGLKSEDIERWKRVCEGLEACREDIASGQARLEEEVRKYEHDLAAANQMSAAEKVISTEWDSVERKTKELERQEDLDAARDERRTAMGTILPPCILGSSSLSSKDMDQHPPGSSRRPTLLLLSSSLPAAVRARVRDSLDHNAPNLFGLHLAGEESVPTLAEETRTRELGFLDPGHEQEHSSKIGSSWGTTPYGGDLRVPLGGTRTLGGPNHFRKANRGETMLGGESSRSTRANLVQATLSAGKSVSLDVTVGPGVWARGHFLRDLESLLKGLYGCGGCGGPSGNVHGGSGPTVILVDGQDKNRSGGGADIHRGTKRFVATASSPSARTTISNVSDRPRIEMASATPRGKLLLEEAAQCLHDLSVTHASISMPFQVISMNRGPPGLFVEIPIEEHYIRHQYGKSTGTTGSSDQSKGGKASITTSLAGGILSWDLLLAACCMMLNPERRYYVGEDDEVNVRMRPRKENLPQGLLRQKKTIINSLLGDSNTTTFVSHLAESCRRELAGYKSVKGLVQVLREFNPISIPIDTAVALRHLVKNHAWPTPSPRPQFSGCPASAAFAAWVVAASSASLEIVLGQGGDVQHTRSQPERSQPWPLLRKADKNGTVATQGSTAGRCGNSASQPLKKFVPEKRAGEIDFLEKLDRSMIDEIITVIDDDSSCVFEENGNLRRGRYCRASEVFVSIMDTVLRSFQVFEEDDVPITLQEVGKPLGSSQRVTRRRTMTAKFRTRVSRAFGSIYVQVESPVTGSKTRRGIAMARARDDDLIALLSANWMEKHDLSALRELRNEQAVWRALMDTLVLYLPDGDILMSMTTEKSITDMRTTTISVDERHLSGTASYDYLGDALATEGFTSYGFCGGILSFQHSRRLILETSCFPGYEVPVAVFEESRGNFWCEARIRSSQTSPRQTCTTVGMPIPKAYTSWLLDENHPMRMQAILDAPDLRDLSVLIADRLKLRRVNYKKIRHGTRRDWLTTVLSGGVESKTADQSKRVGIEGVASQRTQSERQFCLSLRKRGVGQVVFSRLVFLWIKDIAHQVTRGYRRVLGVDNCRHEDKESPKTDISGRQGFLEQRLITVKEIAHRGECGELKVEAYDSNSGRRGEPVILTPELTAQLLEGRNAYLLSKVHERCSITRYWQDALLWRLKLVSPGFVSPLTHVEALVDSRDHLETTADGERLSSLCTMPSLYNIAVDLRSPLFLLRDISVRYIWTATGQREELRKSKSERDVIFDLVVLGQPNVDLAEECKELEPGAGIELVATHLQTMSSYRFQIPTAVFIEGVFDEVLACLAAPTSLSTELAQPISLEFYKFVGRWLSFSQDDGGGSNVTLRFPGMEHVTASPFVGLRLPKRSEDNDGEPQVGTNNPLYDFFGDDGGVVLTRKGHFRTKQCTGRNSSGGMAQNSSSRDSDRSRRDRHQTTFKGRSDNVATLKLTTKNERMIFRRRLPILALNVSDKNAQLRQSSAHNVFTNSVEKNRKVMCVELLISVYEAFSSSLEGRVERHLRFCARDENVRPTMEASSMVPWSGTCEGMGRSDIWQVITEGLKIRYEQDEGRKCIRMHLDVITQGQNATRLCEPKWGGSLRIKIEEGKAIGINAACGMRKDDNNKEDRVLSGKLSRDNMEPFSTSQQHGRWINCGEPAAIRTNDYENEVGTNSRIQAKLGSSFSLRHHGGEGSALKESALNERQSAELGDNVGRKEAVVMTKTVDDNKPSVFSPKIHSCPDKVSDSQNDGQIYVEAFDGASLHIKERNIISKVFRGAKIFDEWLCITGIRLHVLCFQEESAPRAVSFTTCSYDIDGTHLVNGGNNSRFASGREGQVSLPRRSYLRFIACDPVDGRRTSLELPMEDLCMNSSTMGGVVEADLLLDGRRPALAKAIASQLKLMFEADGGYKLILPLPKEWKRRAP